MYNIDTECKKCGKKILINSENTHKKFVKFENGKPAMITYFECNHCGERHVVQLDNVETQRLLSELTKKVARMARMKRNHSQMSKKEVTKIAKIRTDLADMRLELVKEFQGMHYYEEENEYTLEVCTLNG